jgi:DNA-binding GntR family transcriptional regulator
VVGSLGHRPVNQQVYFHILNLVLSGTLAPGSRLDEQSLAATMGVSRTPLREAIGRLVEKGLVEYRPYQGNFVRTFTAEEVSGIYQVRRSLEELAIRSATARMTPERLAEIRGILHDLARAMERGDVDAVGEADRRFHATIARFSGNATLIAFLADLDHQVQIIRSLANRNPEVVQRTALQRPQILAALEAGDADAAARLLGEHIEFVRQTVVAEQEADASLAAAS